MEKITFSHVVPQVFSQRTDMKSEIWDSEQTFERGHLYLVEADSGKGKSTFCSYILGYRHDYTGQILLDGRPARELGVAEWVRLRRESISHLFQELRLFPELTAWENVEIKNSLTPGGFIPRERVEQWFESLGIGDKLNTRAGLMSFGQQQRVAMIRALAQPFDFLLADEPISHLDDNNSAVMADIMMSEAKRQGAAVIVTSIGKHPELPYQHVVML